MKGIIKWFNKSKGFGFIIGEDGKEYYFHYSEMNQELEENNSVIFEPTENIAINIKL